MFTYKKYVFISYYVLQ